MCLNEPPQRPSSPRPRHDASVVASPHAAASPLRGTDHTGASGGRTPDAARRIDQQARSGDVFPGVELEVLVTAGVLADLRDALPRAARVRLRPELPDADALFRDVQECEVVVRRSPTPSRPGFLASWTPAGWPRRGPPFAPPA